MCVFGVFVFVGNFLSFLSYFLLLSQYATCIFMYVLYRIQKQVHNRRKMGVSHTL